mgnify:CR=1 FL=1
MDQVIITAALTGAVTPKAKNAHIPITPEEIAADAYACWKAGAAMVHLHMRADDGWVPWTRRNSGRPSGLSAATRTVMSLSTAPPPALLPSIPPRMKSGCPSPGAGGHRDGSYDAGTFNWMPGGVFMNSPQFLEKLGDLYLERGIKPEVEIFDAGMLGIADYFAKQGHLSTPCHYQLCLGVLGGMPATVENLVYLVRHLPENATWSAFGVGKSHLPILYAALALGGHIRVGLEDNVYLSKGVPATNVHWWNGPFKRCAPSESSPLPPLRPEKSWA